MLKTKLDGLFTGDFKLNQIQQFHVDGTYPTKQDLGQLAGCPDGGELVVTVANARKDITLACRHPDLIRSANVVQLKLGGDNRFELRYVAVWFLKPGIGAVATCRSAYAAARLGMSRITLLAAGPNDRGKPWDDDYWGYYAWPRLGFDATLEWPIPDQLLETGGPKDCARVSDILVKDRQWWRNHGVGCQMAFNLQASSPSWDTLKATLLERELLA
jgi:hypothetical protein